MNHHLRAPCAAMLCAAALASQTSDAGSVYKCTLEGKVSYSDMPCASAAATSSTLTVPAAPLMTSVGTDSASEASLQRLRKQAAALEKARRKIEERDARDAERAARSAAAQRKRCAKLALTKQWAEEDVRRAAVANVDKVRLRAKRAGESLSLECPR